MAITLLPFTLYTASASAVEINAGDWTVDVGGIVDAFYNTVSCSGDAVGGIALAGKAIGCGGVNHATVIGNGLLPSGLITKFKTSQDGIDIGGTIGIMVPVSNTNGVGTNSNVDVRQAFFTIGTADMGTIKLGRDYGIFGSNAILGDMTLLGVGAPTIGTQNTRVSLGHIGAGYTYLNSYGQITYTSPVFGGGFTFTAGVMSPVDNADAGSYVVTPNGQVLTNAYEPHQYPQVQAQISYKANGFHAWVGGMTQRFYAQDVAATANAPALIVNANRVVTDNSVEVGASYDWGPLQILGNYQTGKGIGILSGADNGPVRGNNYFVQGTYKVTDRIKLGVNYGQSRNNNSQYNELINGNFKDNSDVTGGVYYSLTKYLTLVGELSYLQSRDYIGSEAKAYGGSVGGIIFF